MFDNIYQFTLKILIINIINIIKCFGYSVYSRRGDGRIHSYFGEFLPIFSEAGGTIFIEKEGKNQQMK
jgi:hypothetical protein